MNSLGRSLPLRGWLSISVTSSFLALGDQRATGLGRPVRKIATARPLRSLVGDDAYHTGNAVVAAGESDGAAWPRFEDGTHTEADLAIGADGVGSTIRQAVIGNDVGARCAGYVARLFLLPETLIPSVAAETLA